MALFYITLGLLSSEKCFGNTKEKRSLYFECPPPLPPSEPFILIHLWVVLSLSHRQDLVKSHLMYAVREEVEVLKEQIKELIERNSQLEQENNLLKNLASPEQMAQFQAQVQTGGSPTGTGQPPAPVPAGPTQVLSSSQISSSSA